MTSTFMRINQSWKLDGRDFKNPEFCLVRTPYIRWSETEWFDKNQYVVFQLIISIPKRQGICFYINQNGIR